MDLLPLRVLMVEDSGDDAELVALQLRRQGYDVGYDRAETAAELSAALGRHKYDVVLSDYTMPGFGGLEALALVRQADPDVPFIIVSGTIGDELAVAAMKAGAHDYVLKQNLHRLGGAIGRELRDAESRRGRRLAEAALRRSEARNRLLARTGELLHASLDEGATLAAVAAIVVPDFADWCVIDLLTEDGTLRHAVVMHPDPARVALARELRARYPSDPDAPEGAARIVRTRQPELVSDVDDARLVAVSRDAEHLRILRTLGLRSYIGVPLEARGQVLGALTLIGSTPARRYGEDDLDVARELARRIASAIDRARLYLEAQAAVRARDEFLSIASHELRTPLTSLVLLMSLLRDDLRAERRPQTVRHFETAQRQVERLTKLVEGVLDVSRISTGRFAIAPEVFDLTAAVREVVERFRVSSAAKSRVELRLVGGPSPVEGEWDRTRVEQVVTNLVDNAIKYGAGKPVDVEVRSNDGVARVTVRDRGIGIAEDALQRIWKPFERAVSSNHYGGLGIGLFIAKEIVEAHGGTIRVESRLGAGSEFTVELPRVPRSRRRLSPGGSGGSAGQGDGRGHAPSRQA